MAELYFYLFIAICIGLLMWGIAKPGRIYQYPFLMGAIFVSFLLPQAFALINNPGAVSKLALERVLLMSCLCAAMCGIGYKYNTNTAFLRKLHIPLDERKLFHAGMFLLLIGYTFTILLLNTDIQTAENSNWTGPATIYIFFTQVIYIALTIFLLLALKKPNIVNITAVIFATLPILNTILIGRRQPTFTFLAIIGISLFYIRRLLPPKTLALGLVVMAAFLIPLLGIMREGLWDAIFTGNLSGINFQDGFNQVLEGKILELRNAAILMDLVSLTDKYGYGTGIWDQIIFQYIPGQILGYDFKESLQFNLIPYESTILLGYIVPLGSTTTGIGESFLDFGYFGCLIFGFIAYFFKHLWISSVYQNSRLSQILYAGMISPALVSVTHGIGRFMQEAIFQLIFIGLVTCYSRKIYRN